MKTNMGGADRVIRVVLGLAIIAAGFYYKSWFGVIGLVPLVTAIVGWCPAYLPFGISTRRAREAGDGS
jgi:type IV secretory pathway TrbD component